jgi:hypothetical protein
MRKILVATAATLGMFAAVGLPTASAAGKTRHFTLTGVGASISPTEFVGVVQGPGGYRGAEVHIITSENAIGGTGRFTLFDARGSILFAYQFTNGKPQNGVIPQTGTGHSVSGTGAYRHVKETYSFKRFYDAKTGRGTSTQRVTQTL